MKPACSRRHYAWRTRRSPDDARKTREYAEHAIKKARGFGQLSASRHGPNSTFWSALLRRSGIRESSCICSACGRSRPEDQIESRGRSGCLASLRRSSVGNCCAPGRLPHNGLKSLKLLDPSEEQMTDLERFLTVGGNKAAPSSVAELADKPHLWVNALRVEGAAHAIQGIEIVPWRTKTGESPSGPGW